MAHDFVHLHVHTDFSLLDGTCRIGDIAEQAEAWGMPAVACTDHGNMAGAHQFYSTMTEKGLKPIIGCEFYVAPGNRFRKDSNDRFHQGYHLVLLAENEVGYTNLCKLNSIAWLEGFYYKPRIDIESLAQHSEGTIALTACLRGEIPAYLREGNEKRAAEALRNYLDIFGRESLFLELQDHGIPEQAGVNSGLVKLAHKHDVSLVVTNDVHYLKKTHASAQDLFLCIGTQTTRDAPNRLKFTGEEFYFKSGEEMHALFADYPEALENTVAIAERCNFEMKTVDDGINHYPDYRVKDGTSQREYLRAQCVKGLNTRYNIDPSAASMKSEDEKVIERMDYELEIIDKTGFSSYFLVVWDFLRYAREQNISIGPGRGSGAGSLAAYLLGITDIDPLRYGLLFERFLNPDRVSPPDFDIDLCERRRGEVITYVREKYGSDNVCQIGTFGTLKAKAVIKDVARTLGRSFSESNTVTQLIPSDPKMTLEKALKESSELRELVEEEEWVEEVIDYSKVLEGLNRNMGVHACGVIISDQPLSEIVPLARGGEKEALTQFPAGPCEDVGLLKMDFLGLSTLTIIQDTLEMIEETRQVKLSASEIPLHDQATYRLLNRGDTVGVFQLESTGMRDLCRRFGIKRIEDLIALIALYRPGPMRFLDDFVARKKGRTAVEYDIPEMEPILNETYGIMLYQEQVMQVVQVVAGFSLAQADILRRAMGKKKSAEMMAQFGRFVAGCAKNGIDNDTAEAIWKKVARFAEYGFNKSHSAAYAMLSYRTAYLKANYPTEFMAAVLSNELGNSDKLSFFLRECREMNIEVRPPDVNVSGLRFSVDDDAILFGLGAIKGVGASAVETILAARKDSEGHFVDLLDFCERNEGIAHGTLEALIKAGAFDSFGLARSQLGEMAAEAISRAQQKREDKRVGQGSLFEFASPELSKSLEMAPPDIPEWDRRELLTYEKEILGFYVSGHPITEHLHTIDTYQLDEIPDLQKMADQQGTRIGGLISEVEVKRSRKTDRPWAIIRLEGKDASVECRAFSSVYEANSEVMQPETVVLIEGTVSREDDKDPQVLVTKVVPIEKAPEVFAEEVHLRIREENVQNTAFEQLKELCKRDTGEIPLVLCLVCSEGGIAFIRSNELRVRNSSSFRDAVQDLFGKNCLYEKGNRTRVKANGNGRNYQRRKTSAAAG